MILVVEDNETQRIATQTLLEQKGYSVRSFASVPDALESMLQKAPRVLVLDMVLGPIPGTGLLSAIRDQEALHGVKVVITTALPSTLLDQPIIKEMAATVLQKPFSTEDLVETIGRLAPLEARKRKKR